MPPLYRGGPTDLMDADISFSLERLFDPYNLDHIPDDRKLDQFKKRDLAHVKHYKAAVKIFGGPLSRKRVINAPLMETPIKHRLGLYLDKRAPPLPPVLNSGLDPQIPPPQPRPPEEIAAEKEKEREDEYQDWITKRMKFRSDLEKMGLNEDWLDRKPNKTALEKRVLRKLKEDRMPKDEPPRPVKVPRPKSITPVVPNMNIPAPEGIKILEKHLRQKKLRLIDLFVQVDKDKSWKVSREEFQKCCREANIPLTESILEDLLLSLDMNLDDELDYCELAKGLDHWRKERRENKRLHLSQDSSSSSSRPPSRSDTFTPGPEVPSPPLSPLPVSPAKSVRSSQQKHPERQEMVSPTQISRTKSPSEHKRSQSPTEHKRSKSSSDHKRSRSKSSHDQRKSRSPEQKTSEDKSPGERRSSRSPSESKRIRSPSEKRMGSPTGARPQSPQQELQDVVIVKDSGSASSHSKSRSSTPQYLELPESDLRPEQLVLSSEEAMVDLRKRDREAMKGSFARTWSPKKTKDEGLPPTVIKVGQKAVDNHSMRSTMGGETAEMVDIFRQLRLREYYEVLSMCREQRVPLNKMLLERVLLYPPDKPPHTIKKKLRSPGLPLLSTNFAVPPKRPKTPIEVKLKDKVKRSKSGRLLIDSRHRYPQKNSVAAAATKENLSTGRAVIRRKVDCWMTFEEYDKLTRHLAVHYAQIHGAVSKNAFWPGQLISKLRVCMDDPTPPDGAEVLFSSVKPGKKSNYGYDNDLTVWPINDSGYVQMGIHDPTARKVIHKF